MALTPHERGKIYEAHDFLEDLYDWMRESDAVGSRVVDINPREVFLKRLRPDEDSPDLPFGYWDTPSKWKIDFLEPATWGVLQPYTLLNELKIEYAMTLGQLRKIGKDGWRHNQTWNKAEDCFRKLYEAEATFIKFMIKPEYECSGLRKIVEWVELIHHILPVEISQYGLRKRSSRFSIALANKIGLSHYTSIRYTRPKTDWQKFVTRSKVFGQSSRWVDSYWSGTNTTITALSKSGNSQLMDELIDEVVEKTGSDKTFVISHFQDVDHTQVVQAFEAFLEELYRKRIEEAYKEALAYFDEVQFEVLELARMHCQAVEKAAQEEARKKRQAEEKARKEKAKKEAEKIAKEEQRKKQIADEKERARLALIRDKQDGLLRKCKTTNMASRFCSILENQLVNSEFTCSWEDLLHRVWVPLGRPKNSEDWNVGIEWVLTSFSWTKSVEDLQKHIEHTMSTVVNPLNSDQSVLLGLLPSDVKTFGRVVSFLEEKEFFNLQPEYFVGIVARPEQEFQHLKGVVIQLFDSSEDISTIDRILGRLLAGEDEAYVLADEGVAFQT